MAEIDFAHLDRRERYKLLVAAVVPRPIALVSTSGPAGAANCAPFSFFNAICNDPPAIALGVNSDPPHEKDTARNIGATGCFVVNLVDEALAPLMNLCEAELAPGISEIAAIGLTALPGVRVAAPRVAEAPVSLECRLLETVHLKPGRNIFIGEVVYLHVRDALFDREHLRIDAAAAALVARMHGAGTYARTTDLFEMPRLAPDEKRRRFGTAYEDGVRPRTGGPRT